MTTTTAVAPEAERVSAVAAVEQAALVIANTLWLRTDAAAMTNMAETRMVAARVGNRADLVASRRDVGMATELAMQRAADHRRAAMALPRELAVAADHQ